MSTREINLLSVLAPRPPIPSPRKTVVIDMGRHKELKCTSATLEGLRRAWESYNRKTRIPQKEFSLELGRSESSFGQILQGRQNLTIEILAEICAKIGVEIADVDPELAKAMREWAGAQDPVDMRRMVEYIAAVDRIAPQLTDEVKYRIAEKAYEDAVRNEKNSVDEDLIQGFVELLR